MFSFIVSLYSTQSFV